MLLDPVGGSEGLNKKEIQENMEFRVTRATSFDKKIRKYSCSTELFVGGEFQFKITYLSQLDDNNQHIVDIYTGLTGGDLMTMKHKLMESIKANKTTSQP
jgi:hypothetical protein